MSVSKSKRNRRREAVRAFQSYASRPDVTPAEVAQAATRMAERWAVDLRDRRERPVVVELAFHAAVEQMPVGAGDATLRRVADYVGGRLVRDGSLGWTVSVR